MSHNIMKWVGLAIIPMLFLADFYKPVLGHAET